VVCPQLFFTCHLRPTNGLLPKARSTYGEDYIQIALVFYSTFELWQNLPCSGSMERLDVQMFFEPTQNTDPRCGPSLQSSGSRQLMPLFLQNNATPTIPYELRMYENKSIRPNGHSPGLQESEGEAMCTS
jgi:hypothetical protein